MTALDARFRTQHHFAEREKGEPLDRVPHGPAVHRTPGPPLLIFKDEKGTFPAAFYMCQVVTVPAPWLHTQRHFAEREKGALPLSPATFWKKVDENFTAVPGNRQRSQKPKRDGVSLLAAHIKAKS